MLKQTYIPAITGTKRKTIHMRTSQEDLKEDVKAELDFSQTTGTQSLWKVVCAEHKGVGQHGLENSR